MPSLHPATQHNPNGAKKSFARKRAKTFKKESEYWGAKGVVFDNAKLKENRKRRTRKNTQATHAHFFNRGARPENGRNGSCRAIALVQRWARRALG
jgi:hypothetical protein